MYSAQYCFVGFSSCVGLSRKSLHGLWCLQMHIQRMGQTLKLDWMAIWRLRTMQQPLSTTTSTQHEWRCMGGRSMTPCVMMTRTMTGAGKLVMGEAGRKPPQAPSM